MNNLEQILSLGGLALVVVAVLAYATSRRDGDDPLIDQLIAANRGTPRPGMESADWSLIARAGKKQWRAALKAQRRSQPAAKPRRDLKVVGGRFT